MTIAIPLSGGKLSPHFGHCEQFALFQVEEKLVKVRKDLDPPPHEPGLLPRWLKGQGVDLVIAGGMGRRRPGPLSSSRSGGCLWGQSADSRRCR